MATLSGQNGRVVLRRVTGGHAAYHGWHICGFTERTSHQEPCRAYKERPQALVLYLGQPVSTESELEAGGIQICIGPEATNSTTCLVESPIVF